MKVLSWNCQGLRGDLTEDTLKGLWNKWHPDIIFLSETKHPYIVLEKFKLLFGFNKLFTIEPIGSSGGLALLYNDEFNLNIISSNNRIIDTSARYKGDEIFISFIYGDPVIRNRQLVWDQLYNISTHRFGPWLMAGDFNEIIDNHEKRGGKLRTPNSFVPFRNMINHCGMLEFICEGNKLSWRGMRMQNHNGRKIKRPIRCRLDRALGNGHWHDLYRHAKVRYLPMIGSDHRPIICEFNKENFRRGRNFRFDKRWIGREGLQDAVNQGWNRTRNFRQTSLVEKIENCRNSISWWRKNNILPNQVVISQLSQALEDAKADDHITEEEINKISKELKVAHRNDEIFWQQKSRNLWLQAGDKNTKFFQTTTKNRRARNLITGLTDTSGIRVESDSGIEKIATDYFNDLFRSQANNESNEFISAISPRVTTEMNQRLLREISEEEVKVALFSMHPEKSPGPDGFTALFYQTFWGDLKKDLVDLVRNFFRTKFFDPRLNLTNICLIPKIDKPSHMGEFRPISLCNISYKLISKVLGLRLKEFLPKLISETQSAFVSGRLISDNILIAQELFYALRTNEAVRDKFIAIKTDMSKAYDRLEWSFIESTLLQLGFHPHWVSCVMWCITSVSFQVLINGSPKGHIIPTKGIRQGDPLSPYLFIICTEALAANLRKRELNHSITGLKVARGSPAISHLLFADDSLFFCKASVSECSNILDILTKYESVSGQMINYNKSSVVFGSKVPTSTQHELKNLLGIHQEGGMGNYLGIPESLGGSKAKIFNYVKENVNGRVNGWSSKLLSKAGKEVMLKSVAFALPNHVMSCFRLPKSLITKLDSAVSNFWWSSSGTTNGIHWISWDELCNSKQEGGLGFRSFFDFNTALLAKQLWRLDKYPNSLVARVLRGRYYPRAHPFQVKKPRVCSYGWRSLLSAQTLVTTGSRWRVGDGKSISVWEDPWIPDSTPRPAQGYGRLIYPNLRVHELMTNNGNSWNIPLLNQLFDQEDVLLVRSILLRPMRRKDRIIWHATKSGDYTVKTGYAIQRASTRKDIVPYVLEPSTTAIKAHTWKEDCPPKICHFMWQITTGSLAVLSQLRKRGMNLDILCKECGTEEETINHVLFECEVAKNTWNLLRTTSMTNDFPSSSIYTNMDFLFWRVSSWRNLAGDTIENREVYPWILWYLWKSRNKKVFQGIGWSASEIIQLAEKELILWQESKSQEITTTELVIQDIPTLPANHCFVDGSWKEDEIVTGFGWICYSNNQPILMGARGTRRSMSSLYSEFEALLWAMEEVVNYDLPCQYFLTDSQDLVKITSDPDSWPAFDIHLETFEELRRRIPTFTLQYTPRDSNKKADALARGARERCFEFSYVNGLPPLWAPSLIL